MKHQYKPKKPAQPKRPAPVKARIMWISQGSRRIYPSSEKQLLNNPTEVSVLPRSPATDAIMIEQGARAMRRLHSKKWVTNYPEEARAVLRSAGLLGGGA